MWDRMRVNRWWGIAATFVVLWLCCTTTLWACPNCKDALAQDGNAANLVRGYYYSILFMMSMPFLILGGLAAYFYYEVRRARLQQMVTGNMVVAPCVDRPKTA